MSGRPSDFVPFASTATYPTSANPWSNTPTKTAPVVDHYDPASGIAAQEFNYEINLEQVKIIALQDYVGQVQALNFPYTHTFVSARCATYDSFNSRWLVCDQAVYGTGGTNVINVYQSFDGAQTWSVLFTPSGAGTDHFQPTAVATNPNTGLAAYAYCVGGGTNAGIYTVTTGGTGASAYGIAGDTAFAFSEATFFVAANQFVFLGGEAAGTANPAILVTGDATGTTWTRNVLAMTNDNLLWAVAQSPNLLVAMPRSAIAQPQYVTMTAGGAITIQTMPSSLSVGNPAPSSLSYDNVSGLFVLVSTTLTGCTVHTSADGINWTLVSTLTTKVGTWIACAGALWAIICTDRSLIFSVDKGQTWRRSPSTTVSAFGASPASPAPGLYPRLLIGADSAQFLALSSTQTAASLMMGLPSAIVT